MLVKAPDDGSAGRPLPVAGSDLTPTSFDGVFGLAVDGVLVVDLIEADGAWQIVYANQAWAEMVGEPTRADMVGEPHAPIPARELPLADGREQRGARDRVASMMASGIGAGRAAREELCLRRRDGGDLWAEVSVRPLQPMRLLVELRDVGSRRAAEAARLSAAYERLDEVVGSIEEGFGLWDPEDRLVLANEPFRQLFPATADLIRPGVAFEQVLRANMGQGCYDIPGDPEAWLAARLARRTRQTTIQEIALHDGRRYRVTERKTPNGSTVTIWVDITALKKAEQRLRDAIDSVSEGFILFDADERLVLCNERYPELNGVQGDRIVPGVTFLELLPSCAGHVAQPAGAPQEAWDAERLRLFREGGSYEQETADGRWLLGSFRRTAEGGTVGVQTDVTLIKQQEIALRRSEEKLRAYVGELEAVRRLLEAKTTALSELAARFMAARDSAEEASRSKSRFLAMMSHELRTPLNAVIGFSEVIERQALGPVGVPRYVEYARDMRNSGRHLLDLINDILDMSKIEAGKYELHCERVDPREIIRHCTRMVRLRAEEAEIQFTKIVDENLPAIEADPRALKQILLNLLSNAIKFTRRGGSVTVAATAAAGRLEIRVEDTGIGIPADSLARIGRPFEQVDNEYTRAHAGTGLGLALTRSLVEMHGGTLAIESEPGSGTRVSVVLPVTA
ncbi:PAS-domain containing protein [Arenibaculum sp.]|uniref:sensor histidine kinase n=1 Tax=Arenibaculum sp. TaxID=2865862 RepID=UPI002E14D28A|nr:PAS-domain containing protein [Arenibaculum sp.]